MQELQREIEERNHISSEPKGKFEQICTYGPENLATNPLEEMDSEVFKSEIEQKRGVMLGRMLERQ